MTQNTSWQTTNHGLYKQFSFENFKQAFAFMTRVAAVAEQMQHHPRWENEWSTVQIWLITHDAGSSITDKDWALAAAIDGAVASEMSPHSMSPSQHKASIDKITLFADGGSRGNPGPSASGYVLYDKEDNALADEGVYLGITTNNQAEYTALKLGLERAIKLEAEEVEVYMDSLLVINQMKGIFKVKNRDLWPIHDAIMQLLPHFKKISFGHVPRELNKAADAAVNRALDEQHDRLQN